MRQLKVHSLWLAQDDPKKNTAVLSSKRGDITLHKRINTLPKKGIILEPLCGKIFGPEDHELLIENNGSIVGLDCSWKQIEPSVELVMKRTRLKPRMLPCQAIMKKQSGSSKPCKSAAVLKLQDQASCYMIAAILIGA